jgi:response regulator of citrate/malate metabolism
VESFRALWEGPFANSIMQSAFFDEMEQEVMEREQVDQSAVDILRKLEDRKEENKRKFPWKELKSCY